MKFYIVTGGAGFLGSNLTLKLLREGHGVISLDDYSSSSLKWSEEEEIFNKKEDSKLLRSSFSEGKYKPLVCDVADLYRKAGLDERGLTNLLESRFKIRPLDLGRVAGVYHLACPASPPVYQKDPVKTMMTNVLGTKAMLDIAKTLQVPILFSSTSEIYGDPEVHPQKETYRGSVNSFGPRSCYDEGKRAAEALCYDYINQYDVDARIVRIFNTYGPYMNPDDGRVITNFIKAATFEKDIPVYGTGDQTRSFCYVDDLIEGMSRFMNKEKVQNRIINLGNPSEITIKELAEVVISKIESRSMIRFKDLPVDDPTRRKPDIALAKKELDGWEPVVTLEEGILSTANYMIKVL